MYGKGEGGKISGEYAMKNPNVVTAGITYSWGWWKMPSELTEAIDPLKNAPEFYMVLGLRDLSYHLTTVRDTYARVNAKGYHVIYREFEDLGARTYHPPSNDDAIAWATRLRNKNLPLSAAESKLLKRFAAGSLPAPNADGYYSDLALVGGASAGEIVQKLLASGNPAVRAAAAETCLHTIFSEETLAGAGQGNRGSLRQGTPCIDACISAQCELAIASGPKRVGGLRVESRQGSRNRPIGLLLSMESSKPPGFS